MNWNDETLLEFTKIFLKHDCLWNPAHPARSLLTVKKKAYSDVSSEFKSKTGISLNDAVVISKIQYLRSRYRKETNKIFRHSCPGFTYEPPLWFKEMDRCYKTIPGQGDSIIHQTNVDTNQIWVDNDNEQRLNNLEADSNCPLTSQTNNDVSITAEYGNIMQKETTLKIEKPKSDLQTPTDFNSESMLQDDEFDIYGKLLASQLRKLNIEKGLQLQLEIQSLISEARLSDLLA